MCSPLNINHHFSVVSNLTLSYFSYFSQQNYANFPSTGQDVQFFQKIRLRKPVPEWNLGLRRLMGIAWLLYFFFSQCTRFAQNCSSFFNVQDMCNIIQLNVNISNTHWGWKSIRVRDGPLIFRGGYRHWEKNCLHEKKCWNKLPAPEVHLEKIVCRDHLCYARFEEFKKIVCTARVAEKTCNHSIDGGKKISCLPEITISPRGKK